MESRAMFQQQIHIPKTAGSFWYVSDLPDHNGLERATGAQRNSDWGFTTDPQKAILLTPYWQRRFIAYCRRDWRRPWGYMSMPSSDAA